VLTRSRCRCRPLAFALTAGNGDGQEPHWPKSRGQSQFMLRRSRLPGSVTIVTTHLAARPVQQAVAERLTRSIGRRPCGRGWRRQIPRCDCFKASFIKTIKTNKRAIITETHGGALQKIENREIPRRAAPMTNTETQNTLRKVRLNACRSCSGVQLLRIPALPVAALAILDRPPRCAAITVRLGSDRSHIFKQAK
jgi:hypothetical protein